MQRRFRVREFTWPVHWQGYLDYQRHQDRLERALRQGDEAALGREVLTVREEGKTTRIAFQFLRQYGFEFDRDTGVRIGHLHNNLPPLSGDCRSQRIRVAGDLNPGEVSPGQVAEAGMRDYIQYPFFASKNVLDTVSAVYREWVLPGLSLPKDNPRGTGIAGAETTGPLDIKRTLLANLARNSREGQGEIRNINEKDIRYRLSVTEPDGECVPVVFLLRDVSSSMGNTEKFLSRYGFGIITAFLNEAYPQARRVFIIHDVAAREVSPEEFFSVYACGGTTCASAYRLMLEIMRSKYSCGRYVFYGIHISDGNIRLKDGLECRRLAKELIEHTAGFACLQVGEKEADGADSLIQTLAHCIEKEDSQSVNPAEKDSQSLTQGFFVEEITTQEEMVSGLKGFFRDYREPVRSSAHGLPG